MGHGCRICQSVAVGTAVGVAVGSGSSHPAVVNVRKTNSPPNHTEGRPTIFCVNSHPSRTATPSRRHPQEHTAGPTTSIILTKLVQPSTLSYPLTPVRHPTASGAG